MTEKTECACRLVTRRQHTPFCVDHKF